MLKKARQSKHGYHPTILLRCHEQEGYRMSLAEHNIGEKEIITIASLLKDMTIQLHELNVDRTPNIGFFVSKLMAQKLLKMQDAHLAEQSLIPIRPQHQQRQRQNHQFGGGANFDYYVDRKTEWRYYGEEPRGNPPTASSSSSSTSQSPMSQWQTSWSSWQPTSSEKWW